MSTSRLIGPITLTLMSVSAILSLRNLPMMAIYGWASVSFYLAAALLFFVPLALVCAELGASFREQGGVYLWVKAAFGPKAGLLAIWLEWIESVVWLPTVLTFMGSLFAYLIEPQWANEPLFLLAIVLSLLWGITFLNFLPIQISARISALGILLGTIVPCFLLIGLSGLYLVKGLPTHIDLVPTFNSLLPSMDAAHLVFFTTLLLGFSGIEVAAYHLPSVKNPKKTFPLATFMAAGLIVLLSLLGSLSIAFILPAQDMQLHAGPMQAFSAFFDALHLPFLTPVVSAMALIGAFALVNTWIIGPSKGLHAAKSEGLLPRFCHHSNRHESPVNILLSQAIISTVLALAFLLMPSINSAYLVLNILAAQLIVLMYLMVFLAALKLRYSDPNRERAYRVPGGKLGIWLMAILGVSGCLFGFFFGFIPPEELQDHTLQYSIMLLAGFMLFMLPVLVWIRPNKKAVVSH